MQAKCMIYLAAAIALTAALVMFWLRGGLKGLKGTSIATLAPAVPAGAAASGGLGAVPAGGAANLP